MEKPGVPLGRKDHDDAYEKEKKKHDDAYEKEKQAAEKADVTRERSQDINHLALILGFKECCACHTASTMAALPLAVIRFREPGLFRTMWECGMYTKQMRTNERTTGWTHISLT